MKDVVIYSLGICCCSVCTDLKDTKAIEAEVNRQSPTGIDSPWTISKDKTFRTGQKNPCVCEDDSKRRHFLLNC